MFCVKNVDKGVCSGSKKKEGYSNKKHKKESIDNLELKEEEWMQSKDYMQPYETMDSATIKTTNGRIALFRPSKHTR